MLFVCYANNSKNIISDTFIKWRKGKINTPKSVKALRKLLAEDVNEDAHNIKIISWKLLKEKKKKKVAKPSEDTAAPRD
jgi:hypothetical protein